VNKKMIKEMKMKLKQFFCGSLCKETPFKFKSSTPIEGDTVRTILKEAYPNAEIRIADSYYDLVPYSELLRWLNTDSLEQMHWIIDIWDCDDFARESRCRMMRLNRINNMNLVYAYCEGWVPGGYHAFNLSICDGIKIIEPQNDDTKDWKKSDYQPDFIQV
jgi:hypothetical protein